VSAAASPEGAELTLTDITPLSKALVRASPTAGAAALLACPFGESRRQGDGALVLGTGPDEWLVLAPAGTRPAIAERVAAEGGEPGELVSVVDVTHGGFLLRLSGRQAARVLEKVCALDFSDRATPNGKVQRSSVARLVCDIARDDLGTTLSYLLHGDRSAGRYFFDALLDAGTEFSIGVGAYPDKEI
jgi:heterotetrameric sarcosine oxidase gamma subunit